MSRATAPTKQRDPSPSTQANELFKARYSSECRRVNKFMIWLMVAQWLVGIGFSLFFSPLTWIGQFYEIHVHVIAAVVLGGAISGVSILWLRQYPEAWHSRHVVAITQMLWSALLIHLSGGRIETHFHVFASLAILSIYRDWTILITAAAVVAVDHFIRGVFYPLSAFGVAATSPWRWIEHTVWVIFEVSFLVPACIRLRNEIKELCLRQTEIEAAKASVESSVAERTEELASATSMLDLILQSVPEGIVATDNSGKYLCVNRSAEELLGKSVHPSQTQEDWPNEFSLHDPRGVRQLEFQELPLYRAMQGEFVHDYEMLVKRSIGNALISVDAKPMNGGSEAGAVCVFRDITDERKRENQTRMLRAAVDNANEAMFTIDINQRFVGVNEYACRQLGYSREELLRLTVFDICHSHPFESWEHVWREIKERRSIIVEGEHVTKNGDVFPVETSLMFVNYEGVEYIYAFARDISDRKSADKERARLATELQIAARKAGMAEIATGVLHNVGNVLNSVNVSTNQIQKRLRDSSLLNLKKVARLLAEHENDAGRFIANDPRGRHVPEYVIKVAETLTREHGDIGYEVRELARNVEHIKQIVAAQQSAAKSSGCQQELSIEELINDSIAANRGLLEDGGIKISVAVDNDLPVLIADRSKAMQILINLIKNAKDALVEYASHTPEIRVLATCEDGFIVFKVIDNGIGIEPELIDQIFSQGYTTKASGHGFGLHSCANAATVMSGSLTVTSDGIGQGAAFQLKLPAKPKSLLIAPTEEPHIPAAQNSVIR